MPAAANPIYANVAFFRIPEYDTRPVSEQALRKDALESSAKAALAGIPANDRVVLDAEGGLAVILFGDPRRALDVAQAIHESAPQGPVHAGLNYGPLALTARSADAKVFGDGLESAAAAARFAPEGRLLVTQDFARALEATAPERASELAPAGEFTDTRVRLHSFYTPDLARRTSRRRRNLIFTIAGVVTVVAIAVIGRETYERVFPPPPAIVSLDVKPAGELFVDGVAKGRTPPLTELPLTPGRHVLVVRRAGNAPLQLTLDVEAGQKLTVTHRFGGRTETKQGLWRDLKRRFGL